MTETNARMAALEAVVAAVAAYEAEEDPNWRQTRWGAVHIAMNDLRALPAPAQAQAQGETVAVWQDEGHGEYRFVVPEGHLDKSWQRRCGGSDAIYVRLGTTLLPIRVEGGGE